ncbi:MAG: segregation and condensation protein A [Frankia sp.]
MVEAGSATPPDPDVAEGTAAAESGPDAAEVEADQPQADQLPGDQLPAVPAEALVPAEAPVPTGRASGKKFIISLKNFNGPFDLLLSLIAKHKLDVTEVALSQVTDEFVAYIRAMGPAFDLGQASEFLVIAATLLDLKAARLLPGAISDDEADDLALLESRDLLFARLLQYRAYKQVAALFSGLVTLESRFTPRAVALEPRFAAALPEVVIGATPEQLAVMTARLRDPMLPPQVAVDHVHAPRVNVREHMQAVIEKLLELGSATFLTLCDGCGRTIEVVARFLSLLELFREGRVAFDQPTPLGVLTVRWVTNDE